jgi:lysophospholipase L1-like esterase
MKSHGTAATSDTVAARAASLWLAVAAAIACAAAAPAAGRLRAAEPVGAIAVPAAAPAPSQWDRWEKNIKAIEDRERESPPPAGCVLFLGSSNIRMWYSLAQDFPDHDVVNRGFGGCQMADIDHFAERLIGESRPAVIVVSAGANDIHAGRTPEQVRDAFAAFVATARAIRPEARIIYLGIAATTARIKERPEQRRAFELIQEFVSGEKNIEVIDLENVYCNPDGTIDPECLRADKLHPSPKGNARRAAIIRPRLGPAERPSSAPR